jgi:hypothetical protein
LTKKIGLNSSIWPLITNIWVVISKRKEPISGVGLFNRMNPPIEKPTTIKTHNTSFDPPNFPYNQLKVLGEV